MDNDGVEKQVRILIEPTHYCETCVFFESLQLRPGKGYDLMDVGRCRRYAPKEDFAKVHGRTDWCGEYQPGP